VMCSDRDLIAYIRGWIFSWWWFV